MSDGPPDAQPCRTCGKPRGENIAEGTRCNECGRRQALRLCLASGVAGVSIALTSGASLGHAGLAGVIVTASLPFAFVVTVVLHELTHAISATLLGQTVVRVIVGEGRALFRLGRQPQLVVGRVVMGNGVTTVLDLRRAGYRWRTCVTLLTAPAVSLLLAAAAWYASAGWGPIGRSAGLTFAVCNLAMATITMLPMPTFGGRVWSDLASALFILRAPQADVTNHMVLGVRESMAAHIDSGEIEHAIVLARTAVDVAPRSSLAHSLLAFALHTGGRPAEARDVAKLALLGEPDTTERAYLLRFVDDRDDPPRAVEDGRP
jgi:hypothetical protein